MIRATTTSTPGHENGLNYERPPSSLDLRFVIDDLPFHAIQEKSPHDQGDHHEHPRA